MTHSISRELLGKIVDDVFDGAIEDPSVIEQVYAAIKKHESPAPYSHLWGQKQAEDCVLSIGSQRRCAHGTLGCVNHHVPDVVEMDEDDRTPVPEGYDVALWRKADEVHHAMALVAADTECVKIIYAALDTTTGLALVPVKMTAAMINAWSGGLTVSTDENAYHTTFQDAWARVLRAALATAPEDGR